MDSGNLQVGNLQVQRASLTYPFTPEGQQVLIEHLRERRLLDDRRFRSIHPRNTGLITYLAYIKRQGARGKPFRSRGSSRLIHHALLELLLNPQPLESVSRPQPVVPQRSLVSAWR